MKNKSIAIIRWIGLLPASFLAAFAGYALFKYAFLLAYSIDETTSYPASFLCGIASGVSFVMVGVKTAPSSKIVVAYVLFTLSMLLYGASLMLSIMQKDGFQLVRGVAGVLGGIIALIAAKSESK